MFNSKNNVLNAITAILFTLVNGVLGIIVTRLVILHYGSDFNGLNSTANQIVNVLLIFEGGFTIASNVALFKPISENDYDKINGLLYLTRKKFRKISLLCLFFGFLVAFVYTYLINSNLQAELVFCVIFMTVISTAFNLFYATTYRVLLQSNQKEYIINIIMCICIGTGHLANVVIILNNGNAWLIRFTTMIFSIISSVAIGLYAKKIFKYLNLKHHSSQLNISGTKDVMIQKITGVIYNSVPIVFLSISPSAGTVLASVYAVYNNVLNMVKSLLRGVIDAPRHGLGLLISKDDRKSVWDVFYQYEYITIVSIFIVIVTTYVMILPFISIYTSGVQDAEYYDFYIAFFMILIAYFELIHIPSGHLMNMAGEFKIGKIFQNIACIVLIILMPIGLFTLGVYGLLLAVALVSILLAILEIGFVHCYYFKNKLIKFLYLLVSFTIFGILLCIIEKMIFTNINSIISFIGYGVVIFSINSLFAFLLSYFLYKKQLNKIIQLLNNLL